MSILASQIGALFGRATGMAGTLFGGSQTARSAGDPVGALRRAETNSNQQVARTARQPQVARELERFENTVRRARSVDDILNDREAMKVLLTANGLESQLNARGLIKRVLTSDLRDATSAVYQMARVNRNWLSTAQDLDFQRSGLRQIQSPLSIERIKTAYAQARWEESLDQEAPGLALAVIFKRRAASLDTPIRVLGDPVAREVVMTTLGIPPQLANQSVESQARALERRLDVKDFKDPRFVDNFARRYLLTVNAGSGNVSVQA
jgi:hypothetical protein